MCVFTLCVCVCDCVCVYIVCISACLCDQDGKEGGDWHCQEKEWPSVGGRVWFPEQLARGIKNKVSRLHVALLGFV